ncbi:MAG: Gfo/Idh/MocA family oxidoreductase [Chloroflexi bacterium]|nr:MAG: Gfo/Idh/MocA family oxidoreductase [Chloroflexota bacterium]
MLKIGIVGFGYIAQHGHTPFYKRGESVQVVGVADCCEARLSLAKEYFPDAKFFLSAQEMFQELGPALDVVDICTPPSHHYSLIAEALSSGYHTICEKPLVTDLGQMSELFRLSQTSARLIYPCHNYQFSPAVRMIKSFIAQDYIGTPQRVVIRTCRPTHAKGVAEWRPDWRRQREHAVGGILMDHGPHSLYLAQHFLNHLPLEKVSCNIGSFGGNDFNTEDTAQLEVMYEQGAQAMIYLSWASTYRTTKYLIVGTHGYIEFTDDMLIVSNADQRFMLDSKAEVNDPSHHNWYKSMFIDFQEKLAHFNDPVALLPLLEAHSVVAAISAAYASATRMGEWTTVERPAAKAQQS